METKRANFTQTPNIVFDLLESDCDIVAYQKMLRHIGMGNSFKGGVRALATRLGISVGKVVKLGAKLREIGFIEITKGDNSHGESDTWALLDIWHLNTCSRNETGCSPNDTGQEAEEGENSLNAAIIDVQPVHETTQPCSPNETATCSLNDTHKENIFSEENYQENVFVLGADAACGQILDGLRERMKLNTLPHEHSFVELAQWAFINKITAERVLLCYDTLERQRKHPNHWRKGRVTAKNVEENITILDDLITEIDDLEKPTEKPNGHGKQKTNGSSRNGSATGQTTDEYLRSIGASPARAEL